MAKDKRRRVRYVVDRRFQFRLIATFLLSVLGGLALFTALVSGYYWFSGMTGENLFDEFITIERRVMTPLVLENEDGELVEEVVPRTKTIPGVKRWELVVPPLLVNNIAIMVFIIFAGIAYSHRIAGPLHHINEEIKRALEGEEVGDIKLRRRDGLQDLAANVSELIKRSK